ncbi:MAG: electron transfer flavoprotein subunit alpha/FixB family protein, partial [Cellulomonadaceae bacterium]|nr:electron transfer flavoprotein subunit alpha/FixB family protein [Cellulomonadaceae bacterium]
MSGIHVVAVDATHALELVALAAGIVGSHAGAPSAVHLVSLGACAVAPGDAEAAGAATVTVLDAGDVGVRPEAYAPALVALLAEQGTDLLLVGAGVSGWEIAARVATALGLGLVSEASALRRADGGWVTERVVFAGGAVQTETWHGPAVVTVAPGRGQATPGRVSAVGSLVERTVPVEVDGRVQTVARTTRPVDAVDLAGAARVVCVGMGVGSRDDLATVVDLADALGAEIACTRPVAEDREWLPTSRYIGISGVTVRPDLYLGVGVSGQVQHTVGMRESRVVVGIDTNPDATLLAQSDIAVVGDQREIVPLLIDALRASHP